MNTFATLELDPSLSHGLDALGYTEMTPVQAQGLPLILAGRDLIAQAPTGSGKTAAFGLGLLQRIDASNARVQALVLCPTRELADQVAKEIRKLATGIANLKVLLLTGGVSLRPQLASLGRPPHLIVGTPGRVLELLKQQALKLGSVRTLVLDEADRMLDMGFEDDIRQIASKTSKERQTLLFSATFPAAIRELAPSLMREPAEITVGAADEQPAIEQIFHEVDAALRPGALAALLLAHRPESAVVFCNMRRDTEELVTALHGFGFSALALHGDMEQRDRDEILLRFANGSCNVLAASDVAARGLDIKDLAAVINYELPSDPDVYLHRIGRTGRAGRGGMALSLVAPREMPRAHALRDQHGQEYRWASVVPLRTRSAEAPQPKMATLRIDAGKTDKLRAGDILGALTGDAGLKADAIGKIDIFPTRSYVAIRRELLAQALKRLSAGKIKGRNFRVRAI
ncbi:MAG: ATP-dependent RNA helicase DbpA [Xanthomonadaceae bacterium]|nr:ATP-dependent RNA helicase DbpA [Xanthomonadaceae bacterium]MDP2186458.1 ATP-dependent RNA helicase DbpA [Xanthomonadales bacterium]MDZ4115150.1 ATP-dependent RNA helicase DbpA [Xanthomonadaceae bacterium]MDZ4377798.1 ATP-dependent RNA helicase DbpA [Xanthomonadaceae bacterium]